MGASAERIAASVFDTTRTNAGYRALVNQQRAALVIRHVLGHTTLQILVHQQTTIAAPHKSLMAHR